MAEETKPQKKAEGAKSAKAGKGKDAKASALVGEAAPPPAGYVPRLRKEYREKIAPALLKEGKFPNIMAVPHVEKISINMGIGEAKSDAKVLEEATYVLTMISGQKPVARRAKKAISNFSLRAGMPVGARVTLRGARMYEFLDRMINLSLPRVRDFRGMPTKSFDGRGNYTVGVKEQMIFPEIDFDKVEKVHGMDITIVTTAGRDDLAMALLREFGWPFRGETPPPVDA